MLKFKHACLSLFPKKTFWITLKASKIQPHKNFLQLENFVNHMSRMNFYIFIKSFGYVIWRIYYTRDYGLLYIHNIKNIINWKISLPIEVFVFYLGCNFKCTLSWTEKRRTSSIIQQKIFLFVCLSLLSVHVAKETARIFVYLKSVTR